MALGDESARHREAARAALGQIDWCVEYLRRIRKTSISRQREKNKTAIRPRMDERGDDAVTRGPAG
jgi:hypothetical protein